MPSRWQHSHSQQRFPSLEDRWQLSTDRTPLRKSQSWGDEAEAPPWTTESEQHHIQREEEQLHSDCIAPHPGCTALHQEGPSGPKVSPVIRREPQGDIHLSQSSGRLSGRPIPVLPLGNHWGNLQRLNRLQIQVGEGAGLTATSAQISWWISFILAAMLEQRNPSQGFPAVQSNTSET